MSNPLYGSFLLDDEQVEKALKTPEGIARVASLTLSMKKKGLLSHIDKYSNMYNVPREYVFGIILDEQFRSHSGDEVNQGDLGDNILSTFWDMKGTSTGMAQTEPLLVAKALMRYDFAPASAGGHKIENKLYEDILEIYTEEYVGNEDHDTGIVSDDLEREADDSFDFDVEIKKTSPDDLSDDFYSFVENILTSNDEFVIEFVAFLLNYYRKQWQSVEGLQNLENWHDSIDEWDTIAYTYSRGLESLRDGHSLSSPREREEAGLAARPSGTSRGKGIGQIGREALAILDDLDGKADIQESFNIVKIRKMILEELCTKIKRIV